MTTKFFKEILYDAVRQEYRIDKVLYDSKTQHQHLVIFENAMLGRVMTLDGVVQTTEADEFIYHEMLTHVPLLAHGNAQRVLILGGGDGGMLREVCKHPIEHITQVEIDQSVVDIAVKYLPNHSAGAYHDPRLSLIISDGIDFLTNFDNNRQEKYDVIISDCTDPIGPGESLFSSDFYTRVKGCLRDNGIFVAQNGVPFFQREELQNTYQRMDKQFLDRWFFSAPVPTYYGGSMSFAWGTDNTALRKRTVIELEQAYKKLQLETKYYTPDVHVASFATPQYVIDYLKNAAL